MKPEVLDPRAGALPVPLRAAPAVNRNRLAVAHKHVRFVLSDPVEQTIISQYCNSQTIVQLIQNMNGYIDPSADIDAFYSNIWDIDSAVGKGLDIWGKIVGLDNGRILKIPSAEIDLGFSEAGTLSATPFGSGVFYSGNPVTQNYSLSDDAFRTLILVKALANITDGSIPSYNRLLQNLFAGRGRCYVNDLGNMRQV
ncbi:DUF2612 domain-containing protein [Paraburkholderia sediminicola]|uniref:DUF2612 domain-containing protein n=1 Tax=Paraburkholderia sediminicola TaxID=458836 RepID=UPI0038BBB22D